jgi:hypothetical protein
MDTTCVYTNLGLFREDAVFSVQVRWLLYACIIMHESDDLDVD